MTIRIVIAAVLVALVSGLVAFVNLRGRTPSRVENPPQGNPVKSSTESGQDKPATSTAPPSKALFEGWDKPAVAIMLSGEMHGYVEPCGCSLDQLGGLSRRAELLRQIDERGWPATAFDVGGLVNFPTRQQGKTKFTMATKCLIDMRYAGVAVGIEELQLNVNFLLRPPELPFLASNLVLFGDPTIEGGPQTHRVVEIGDVKIGVTAVFGPSLKGQVVPGAQDGSPTDFEVLDPAASLEKSLAALQAEKPDLLILLSHAKYDETKKLAATFPQFDLIVTAGGPEDASPKPAYLGEKTLFVAPGQKGKRIPVVGFFPKADKQRLKYELVDLDDKRFPDTPKIVEHMRDYQELLKESNLVSNEPAIDDPRPTPTLDPNPFVGAKVCGECHKSAYEVWQTTDHAKATATLKTGRPGQEKTWINRIYDPECVACHVTGWDPRKVLRYKDGYTGEDATPHLVGQQCENCHGPGGRHTELERVWAKDKKTTDDVTAWRKFLKLDHKKAFDLCVKCHDGDNDPHFSSDTFAEHWDKVAHPGKD